MCKKRWFFFTFNPPLYTQQQTLLLTVSGNKTLAEKISTNERLCKPHFRREAKYRRKLLQTSLRQRSLCKPHFGREAFANLSQEAVANPSREEGGYRMLCKSSEQKEALKPLHRTSAKKQVQIESFAANLSREEGTESKSSWILLQREIKTKTSLNKRKGRSSDTQRERERDVSSEREGGVGERENLVQGLVVRNSVRVADLDGAIGRERS
jgi:hypothetical protein